jgi:hypothetical protein
MCGCHPWNVKVTLQRHARASSLTLNVGARAELNDRTADKTHRQKIPKNPVDRQNNVIRHDVSDST